MIQLYNYKDMYCDIIVYSYISIIILLLLIIYISFYYFYRYPKDNIIEKAKNMGAKKIIYILYKQISLDVVIFMTKNSNNDESYLKLYSAMIGTRIFLGLIISFLIILQIFTLIYYKNGKIDKN